MKPIDKVTNQPRGFFILSRRKSCQVVCANVADEQSWASLYTHISHTLPKKLQEAQPTTVSQVLELAFEQLPSHLQEIHSLIASDPQMESILEQVRKTKLFQTAKKLSHPSFHLNEQELAMASLLFLAYPSQLYRQLGDDLRLNLTEICSFEKLPDLLSNEVKHLRKEMLKASTQCSQCGRVPSTIE